MNKECDWDCWHKNDGSIDFNPRTRKECDSDKDKLLAFIKISIHALVKSATPAEPADDA